MSTSTTAPSLIRSLQPSPLLGALPLVLANGIAIERRFAHEGELRKRLLHHLFDAGQLVALALFVAVVVTLWVRVAHKVRRYDFLALAIVSVGLGALTLRASFAGLAEKLPAAVPTQLWLWALVLVTSLNVPCTTWLGLGMARPWWRWLAVSAGLAAAHANNVILDRDYYGIHFFITLNSLALTSAALHNLPFAQHFTLRRSILGAVATTVLALASLILPPSNLRTRIASLEGAPLARTLGQVRQLLSSNAKAKRVDLSSDLQPWFESRDRVPPIAASTPSLLPRDPIVILLTIDCVRGDILENKRFAKRFSYLRKFAQSSVAFSRARSNSAGTVPSLTTLFSGKHYAQLVWKHRKGSVGDVWPMADSSPRFPELLQQGGVATLNVASKPWLINRDRVVAGFSEEMNLAEGRKGRMPHLRSDKVFPAIKDLLAKPRNGPVFVYAHLLDPHSPYNSGKLKKGKPIDRYASEIEAVEGRLKKFESWLRKKGLLERTTFILTADHGEAFGEHQTWDHSKTVYEELIHVPLWIRVPGVKPREVNHPVSLIDLGPTVLDLMGQPTPGHYMGQSLVPFLRGESPTLTRPIVAEARLIQTMVFPDGMKAIRDLQQGTTELYNLKKDKKERKDLPDGAETPYHRLLEGFFVVHTLPQYGLHAPFRN